MKNKIELKGFRIGLFGMMALYILVFAVLLVTASLIVGKAVFDLDISIWLIVAFCVITVVLASAAFGPRLRNILPQWTHHIINVFSATTFDVFAKIACITLFPFKQTYFDPKKKDVTDQTPTLLIHGYLDNSSVWAYHRYHYRNAGLSNIFTVDLGHAFHSIEEYADVVKKRIREIKALTGKSELRIIGHSMGGVVGAYYAVHLAQNEGITVQKLITMGSPLQGTPLSSIGMGKCVKQMRQNSPFILELTRQLAESSIQCFCQGSDVDIIVFPAMSSTPVHYGFYKVEVHPDLGHISFLFSDEVIKSNIGFLSR